MSDYVTRLFREALGRLEGEYRSEGLDAMALAARSLAADESRSFAAAHSVLDESARLGEMFDPFTYPALAMSAPAEDVTDGPGETGPRIGGEERTQTRHGHGHRRRQTPLTRIDAPAAGRASRSGNTVVPHMRRG